MTAAIVPHLGVFLWWRCTRQLQFLPEGNDPVPDGASVVFALAIASATTAVVALGMLYLHLRRTSRLTRLTGGLGAASVAALLAPIALIAAFGAEPEPAPDSALVEVTRYAVESYQLPTLSLPEAKQLP